VSVVSRYVNASSSALASCRSAVSKPSVNQLYMGASSSCAAARLPCCCHRRPRLMVARRSKDLACWRRAMSRACRKQASAFSCGVPVCCRSKTPRRPAETRAPPHYCKASNSTKNAFIFSGSMIVSSRFKNASLKAKILLLS